jgi:hypothetical protein
MAEPISPLESALMRFPVELETLRCVPIRCIADSLQEGAGQFVRQTDVYWTHKSCRFNKLRENMENCIAGVVKRRQNVVNCRQVTGEFFAHRIA